MRRGLLEDLRRKRSLGVRPTLMADSPAESLLVVEVFTPNGHWLSHPPHKHDRDALPKESYREETYYHRIRPEGEFALQRVHTDGRSLDETIVSGDVVLVPKSYHPFSAPPGYDLYYLNAMATPTRERKFENDSDHEWLSYAVDGKDQERRKDAGGTQRSTQLRRGAVGGGERPGDRARL